MNSIGVDAALNLRHRIAADQRVDAVAGPAGGWIWREGALVHQHADYFSVIGRRVDGVDHLMLRQTEHALVGLLVTGPPGRRRMLLNARAEPGLHGACQFSTTVQSTPSNYERRHGGSATPHIDLFLQPPPGARILHDALQFDWGGYYHRKTKRVLIVEMADAPAAAEPLVWVNQPDYAVLAREPYCVTADLRVAAAALSAVDSGHVGAPDGSPAATKESSPDAVEIALESSSAWTIDNAGIHGDNCGIIWVRTRSRSREITDWVQPLMVIGERLELTLAVRSGSRGFEAAVHHGTDKGLDGKRILRPRPVEPPTRTLHSVRTSAEGGRFWQHDVLLRVVEADDAMEGWMPFDLLHQHALYPLTTSLELRLLLALVIDQNLRL